MDPPDMARLTLALICVGLLEACRSIATMLRILLLGFVGSVVRLRSTPTPIPVPHMARMETGAFGFAIAWI